MSYCVDVNERVTVNLPAELLVEARRAVEAGHAPSVSAYVADAVSAKQQRQQALDELARVFGGPPPAEAWAAVEDNTVLVVPAAALTVACADIPSSGHEVLEVLLNLPVTVIDTLDRTRAQDVGLFLAGIGSREQPTAAHVLRCAHDRGWPVLTADPHTLRALDSTAPLRRSRRVHGSGPCGGIIPSNRIRTP